MKPRPGFLVPFSTAAGEGALLVGEGEKERGVGIERRGGSGVGKGCLRCGEIRGGEAECRRGAAELRCGRQERRGRGEEGCCEEK